MVFFECNLTFNFEKKAKIFNKHFVSKCSLVKNASTLANHKTDERLDYFDIN